MHTQLNEFWVIKTYKIGDDNNEDFSFIMGLSDISMLNSLITALGNGLIDELEITEHMETSWEAVGKKGTPQEGIHYHVMKCHDCPALPNHKYSLWDNRLEAHMREPRKPMPKAEQLKFL